MTVLLILGVVVWYHRTLLHHSLTRIRSYVFMSDRDESKAKEKTVGSPTDASKSQNIDVLTSNTIHTEEH